MDPAWDQWLETEAPFDTDSDYSDLVTHLFMLAKYCFSVAGLGTDI